MLYYVQLTESKETRDLFFDASDELDAASRAYHLYPHGKIVGVRVVDTRQDRICNVKFVDFERPRRRIKRAP